MSVVSEWETTAALIDALEAATGYPVGDHVAPGPTQADPVQRYLIVNRLSSLAPPPDLAASASELMVTYQITSFCKTASPEGRRMCDWSADKAADAILKRSAQFGNFSYDVDLDTAAVEVMDRERMVRGETILDDDAWVRHDRYRITITAVV